MDLELSSSQNHDLGDESQTSQALTQQWHEAKFILSIKVKHVLSQVAVDQVLSSTTTLLCIMLDHVTADLKAKRPEELLQLVEHRACEAKSSLFSGIHTSYLQHKFFAENFHLVVSTNLP